MTMAEEVSDAQVPLVDDIVAIGQPQLQRPWGSRLKDLTPVSIELKTGSHLRSAEFTSVSFRVNNVKQVMCVDYKPPAVDEEETGVFSRCLLDEIDKLAGLSIKTKPLPKRTKHWQIARTGIPDKGLGRGLILAFLYRMVDTEAKYVVAELLKSIIKERGLDYSVTPTGSASKPTRFAGVIKVTTLSTSSDETEAPLYFQNSLGTPIVKKKRYEDRLEQVSPNDSTDSQSTKPKLITPDIYVYKHDDVYRPITAQLLVSLKSGFYHEIRNDKLLKQMMSRLPFQDCVRGLELNACMAYFYKVVKVKDFVYITEGKEFHFYTDSNQFDTTKFISFMRYLGQILAE